MVRPEQRLAELVDDARSAKLRKGIGRRARRDHGAVRQRVTGPVMVGDDDLEAERLRLGDLLDGGDPAVDREHEPDAVGCELREGDTRHAVALLEPARQVPRDVGAELAEDEHGESGGADAVDVVVAVHADALPRLDRGADAFDREGHVPE